MSLYYKAAGELSIEGRMWVQGRAGQSVELTPFTLTYLTHPEVRFPHLQNMSDNICIIELV